MATIDISCPNITSLIPSTVTKKIIIFNSSNYPMTIFIFPNGMVGVRTINCITLNANVTDTIKLDEALKPRQAMEVWCSFTERKDGIQFHSEKWYKEQTACEHTLFYTIE